MPKRHRVAYKPCAVWFSALLVGSLLFVPAHADDRSELAQLRATTQAMIQTLLDQGLLSRERADTLMRQLQNPPRSQAPAGAASSPAKNAPATPIVRVPYIPETLKTQIRNEVKAEVLTQAHTERWGNPDVLPEWLNRIGVVADLRVRAQSDLFARDNLPAASYAIQKSAPPTGDPYWSPDLVNTTLDHTFLTLRARLGVTAKLPNEGTAEIRLATGNSKRPSSSSQVLGNNFNKYSVFLDRAWLSQQPVSSLRLVAGRLPSPFLGSDLLWPDDLALDGIAVTARHSLSSRVTGFVIGGAFPLDEFKVSKADKWLYGLQLGAEVSLGAHTQLQVGLASYDFRHMEGVRETSSPPVAALASTTAYQLSQYSDLVRLKGNTLINLNYDVSPTGPAPVFGLASRFKPVNLTAALTLEQLKPVVVAIGLDYVKNSAFDLADIRRRASNPTLDLAAKNKGFQARVQVSARNKAERGSWSAFASYRLFERDAWVDSFTDTTWHLGGTNYKGYSIGGAYAIGRNTHLGLRWTSTRNLDDGRRDPGGNGNLSSAPLKIDVLQMEVNSQF